MHLMYLMMPEKEVLKKKEEEKKEHGSMSNGHSSQLENSPIAKAGAI